MDSHQIAMAVVNDPAAADLVKIGVNHFLNEGHWDGAVHRLLTPVMYELKKPIYEGMMNMKYGHKALTIAKDVQGDKRVQKYLTQEVMRLIKELRLK